MKNNKEICIAIAMALSAGFASATIIETANNDTDPNTFVGARVGNDLINNGQATLGSVSGTPAFSGSGPFSISGLNDGASALGGTDGTGKTFYNTPQLPATITFNLDTSVNTLGYYITDINTFAGWGGSDATQVNQQYQVLVSSVGSASFAPLTSVNYTPFASGTVASTVVSLTDSTGTLATGIDAIQFQFANNPIGAGTVYQEIDVIGAAVPEPGTISLMSISTIGLFLTRRIRRRRQLGMSILPVRRSRACDVFVEDTESFDIEENVEQVSVFSEIVMSGLSRSAASVKEAYSKADRNLWNYMVSVHERRIERRAALRTTVKTKSINTLDSFLAKIMK